MYARRILTRILIIGGVIGLIIFVIYQILPVLSGPEVLELTPEHGETISDPVVTFNGVTERGRHVQINDNDVVLFEDGTFTFTTALVPGINSFEIVVEDKYGRSTRVSRDFFHAILMQE